jgi:hypothetical protein
MKRAFLSYSSRDRDRVRRVRDGLLPYGDQSWLDEIELRPGDSLWGSIGDAIAACPTVFAFISRDSVSSRWCDREIRAFLAKGDTDPGVRIVPVLLDETPPPTFLRELVHVNMAEQSFGTCMAGLLRSLHPSHAVLLLEPDPEAAHRLRPVIPFLSANREAIRSDRLFAVTDHYKVFDPACRFLVPSPFDPWFTDRLVAAVPVYFMVLALLTPRVVDAVLTTLGADSAAPAAAAEILGVIWWLLILTLVDDVDNNSAPDAWKDAGPGIRASLAEVQRLRHEKVNFVPDNVILGLRNEAWLVHRRLYWGEANRLTFQGTNLEHGARIRDATVFVPKNYALDRFTWLRYYLPMIVADAAIEAGFGGHEARSWASQTGVQFDDYCHAGVE